MNREKVLETIKKYDMLTAGDSVAVGVSGGADSMALLTFLCEVKELIGLKEIVACHFNHGLRGEESDRDERAAREYANKLKIPFISENGDMLKRELPRGESTESFARTLRYDFLFRAAEKYGAKIATAHNMNDVAETVIFNLTRGAGVKGACGIPPVRDNIIRPFIETSREEIEEYCAEKAIPYVTDSSNLTDDYSRNIIRHKVLPVLMSLNENAVENISRFSRQAIDTERIVESRIVQIRHEAKTEDGYSANAIVKLKNEEKRLFFKSLISEVRQPTSELVELACGLPNGKPTEIQLTKNAYLTNQNGVIHIHEKSSFENTEFCEKLHLGENAYLNGGRVLADKFEIKSEQAENFSSGLLNNSLDCDKIVGNLFLRNRREGDVFCGKRRGNTKTLKKLFNEKKIPAAERPLIPIVCDEEGIVWLYGEGSCERTAVSSKTKCFININYFQGEL